MLKSHLYKNLIRIISLTVIIFLAFPGHQKPIFSDGVWMIHNARGFPLPYMYNTFSLEPTLVIANLFVDWIFYFGCVSLIYLLAKHVNRVKNSTFLQKYSDTIATPITLFAIILFACTAVFVLFTVIYSSKPFEWTFETYGDTFELIGF